MIPVVDTAVHPSYDGSIFHGYDVGVLTLDGPAPAEVTRYDLSRSLDDLGGTGVAVGYGASGHGTTGATVSKGQKRAGLIEFEINALPSAIIQNPATLLTADFDSNDALSFLSVTLPVSVSRSVPELSVSILALIGMDMCGFRRCRG